MKHHNYTQHWSEDKYVQPTDWDGIVIVIGTIALVIGAFALPVFVR